MKYLLSMASWISGLFVLIVGCTVFVLIAPFFNFRGISLLGPLVMRMAARGFFVRVRVEGLEKLDPSSNYLYMANHSSFFDFLVLAGYLPPDTRGLEAAEHFKWPLWGSFLRKAGLIPIDRSNPRASLASVHKAAEHLKNGVSILILPEGTRSLDGRLLPFKKLPFKLAKLGGSDICPVGLIGAFEIKRKTSWLLRPGVVVMRIGDPIPAERIAGMDISGLMALTRERIAGLVGEPDPRQEAGDSA